MADTEAIESLVSTLTLKDNLLRDLAQYNAARRDPVSKMAATHHPPSILTRPRLVRGVSHKTNLA